MTTVGTIEERAERDTTRFFAIVAGAVALVLSAVVVFVVRQDGSGAERQSLSDPAVLAPKAARLTTDNATWSEFNGIKVPVSPAGPHKVNAGRASGFDRTEAGAVLAAIHISYRVAPEAGTAVFEPTIREQIVGSDKDKLLEIVTAEAAKASGGGGATAPQHQSQVWAYRVDVYGQDSASLQVLSRTVPSPTASPVFINFAMTVKWVEGDWRLVAPLAGDWSNVARSVPAVPTGYVVIAQP